MRRNLYALATCAFLIAAVAFGIAGNWTFVFADLALAIACALLAVRSDAARTDRDATAPSSPA